MIFSVIRIKNVTLLDLIINLKNSLAYEKWMIFSVIRIKNVTLLDLIINLKFINYG
jgi:hypothetical protein